MSTRAFSLITRVAIATGAACAIAGLIHPALAHASDGPYPPPGFDGPGGCDSVAPAGGWLCMWVDQDPDRSDLFVKRIRTTFTPAEPSPTQACDEHFELSYSRAGIQRTDLFDQFGCDPTGDHLLTADFALNAPLDLDKPICTRTRGPATGNVWTQRTCLTEHHDSTSFGLS